MTPGPSSHPDDDSLRNLLAAARAGSSEALAELLEKFRRPLLLIANQECDPALRPKYAPSDAVQETFLKAHQEFAQFCGQTGQKVAAWLKEILLNRIIDAKRRYGAAKRDAGRERPLDDDDSRNTLPESLTAPESPPDQFLIADEDARRVRAVLERLPPHYAQVILLYKRDELTFGEIGRRLGRSEDGTRMLFKRAMKMFRKLWETTDAG